MDRYLQLVWAGERGRVMLLSIVLAVILGLLALLLAAFMHFPSNPFGRWKI